MCPHERVDASQGDGVLAGSMNLCCCSLLAGGRQRDRYRDAGGRGGGRYGGGGYGDRGGYERYVAGSSAFTAAHMWCCGVMAADVDDLLLLSCAGATAADTARTGATSAATAAMAAAMSAVGESQACFPSDTLCCWACCQPTPGVLLGSVVVLRGVTLHGCSRLTRVCAC